jgi:hypothetical protein
LFRNSLCSVRHSQRSEEQQEVLQSLASSCLKHWNGLEDKGSATARSHGYTNAAKAQKKETISSPIDPASGPSVEERLLKMEQAFMNAAKASSTPDDGQGKRKKPHFCDHHGWCMQEPSTAETNQGTNHEFFFDQEGTQREKLT